MRRNSVLGEDMEYEQLGKELSVDSIDRRNENGLLCEPINYDKDGVETRGKWEFLNEVHRNQVPGLLRNRDLLKKSIGTMSLRL